MRTLNKSNLNKRQKLPEAIRVFFGPSTQRDPEHPGGVQVAVIPYRGYRRLASTYWRRCSDSDEDQAM